MMSSVRNISGEHWFRPDGSQEFLEKAGSADKHLILYDGYSLDLLNGIGRERVIDDLLGWIEHRHAPRQAMAAMSDRLMEPGSPVRL